MWKLMSGRMRHYATYRTFQNQGLVYDLQRFASNPRNLRFAGVGVAAAAAFYATHIEETPISGRRRFMAVGEKTERFFGDMTYRQLLSQYRGQILADTHPTTVRVRKIMDKLIAAGELKQADAINWKIHVINAPQEPPNAFILPGGKVFVFSSILPIAHNDDGLATILSHEFAHQLARHSGENMSKSPFYMAIALTIAAVAQVRWVGDAATAFLLQMPASREMESEADYIGLMIMAKACFNPEEASLVWARFAKYEERHGGATYEFLSTHPSSPHRLANMRQWLDEAYMQREAGNCNAVATWFDEFKRADASTFGIGRDTIRMTSERGRSP